MNKVTIKDVSQLAKVSVGTVSMVLNNSSKVKPSTRNAVLAAIEQLDYRRNPYARSLSLNKSHAIGLIVTDLSNPFFGMIVEFTQGEIDARANSLMIGVSQNTLRLERESVSRLVDSGVDGLILVPAYGPVTDLSHIESLHKQGFPMVSISSYYEGIPCPCVMTDLAKGAYDMTHYLIESGCRRILFLGGRRELVPAKARLSGFLSAHHDAGLTVQPDQILEVPHAIYQCGYEAAKQAMQSTAPDAIMTINDVLSMGVLGYLREVGVRVPEDVSVAGYDDLLYSKMLETPLTTVRQPVREICASAVSLLFRIIGGEKPPEEMILLEPELVIRASTRRC